MNDKARIIENIAGLNEKFNQHLLGKNILIRYEIEGEVTTLFQRGIEQKIQPASTIKLFLLEQLLEESLNDEDYLEYETRFIQKGSGNNLHLEMSYKIGDLINNMMVASSNVASKMLEDYLSQRLNENIVSRVNARNQKRGMQGTQLVNLTGLPHKHQSIRLKDFSIFLDEHLHDSNFLAKISVKEFVLRPKNNDPVLVRNTFKVQDLAILGVKTGTLVPNLHNIIIFFELYGKRGYMLSFINTKAKDRINDVNQVLTILRNWQGV
jgi:D-alanyl-D-alanine carboxypeptidase